MTPMTSMHAIGPHGPPPGLMNPQMQSQTQLYPRHKNLNVPVTPVGPADSQSHMRDPGGRLPGQPGLQRPLRPPQPPDGMSGFMLPPGQAGTNAQPKLSRKEGEGDMNPGDLRTLGALIDNPLSMNAPRPPTASPAAVPTRAPPTQALSMPDLRFGMSEMFANGGGDFDLL